jgi:hypothetical protein
MTELDRMWSQMLEEAIAAARTSGRGHVADYLDLRSRNDALRTAGVRWLFEAIVGIASDLDREFPGIQIEREEPHNFPHKGANMAGSLLRLRHGVRCLTVEAGWTRTPADGFMRGGGLAAAKISHFGIAKMNMDLVLRPSGAEPGWIAVSPDGREASVDEVLLRRHFSVFLGM